MRRWHARVLIVFVVAVAVCLVSVPAQSDIAKNIILMIGDGMGFEQVKAGSFYLTGAAGNICFEPYYKCSAATASADSSVTDSAAAGTAIATGQRVNNGVISQASDGTPYETILEYAKSLGKSTGLATTVGITHATPAVFGAHEASRDSYINIGWDFLYGATPNLVFGGGDPNKGSSYFNSTQVSYAQSIGYQMAYDSNQLAALSPATSRAYGLFAGGDLTYEYDRQPSNTEPHLSQMTAKALAILENDPEGFFVMVEGGKIDKACHSNDIVRTVHEVVEFHNSVQVALSWMAGRTDTMLIVVADHETGGLTVTNQGAGNYPLASWTTGGHTGQNIPFYIYGAGSYLADVYVQLGNMHLTNVFDIMLAALTPTVSVSEIKNQPNGATVSITGKIVTAGTDQMTNTFYVEEEDRSSGIRAYAPYKTAPYGSLVKVTGTLAVSGGERLLNCDTVTIMSSSVEVPEPLSMLTREVGGGSLNEYTPGVKDGVSAHNTGLLLQICGRVTYVDTVAKRFWVDDGCGVQDGSGNAGLCVSYGGLVTGNVVNPPAQDSLVKVTGVSTRRTSGTEILPVIRVRTQSDIVTCQ